ncbi:signal peptidase II [Carnobacterium maltaromaticum LMA28]|jgi:signal peptidase II|uniref:Lipoprotein signal peptidase n=2 Tax=Carnobacterium maltaromaticum TaxID=2751 RepID=K8E409_CARML|nr:signal peptidase II [Carnobacterium maltaromaticum]AOA02079.1 signal peptidase II [Carnobacterium maltaromaticum]KRN64470.1 signal peptidase II [Carnobacterium maltaromaticum DSM 20342]MCI1819996.1 signal peptidase II [Carnobacterium maltaromaticum]CCO11162.2 signal peptidase II [Carnobacterium maltaromaticum LMA28]
MIVYYALAAVILVIDQITKYVVVNNIDLYEVKEVIPGILSWMYIRNTGAAWSILEGQMWFFYIITFAVVIAVIYIMQKYAKGNWLFSLGLSLILAGALGNFIDRLRLGYVVDMIRLDFMNFPIFNVADMSLSIGVAIIILYVLLDEKNKKLS